MTSPRSSEAKTEAKPLPSEDPKLMEYKRRVALYENESKGLSALEKHVLPFLTKDKVFNKSTIAAALKLMHGSKPDAKGMAIAMFNANHGSGSKCPVMSSHFIKDEHGYARFMHLGTTRIWNPDGSINEARMKGFKEAMRLLNHSQGRDDCDFVTKSNLKRYLQICLTFDPKDDPSISNRRKSCGLFGTSAMQALAATAAWDEVFELLKCGEVTDKRGNTEPYVTWEVAEEFFRDSPKAFLRAECGLLPVPKSSPSLTHR